MFWRKKIHDPLLPEKKARTRVDVIVRFVKSVNKKKKKKKKKKKRQARVAEENNPSPKTFFRSNTPTHEK